MTRGAPEGRLELPGMLQDGPKLLGDDFFERVHADFRLERFV